MGGGVDGRSDHHIFVPESSVHITEPFSTLQLKYLIEDVENSQKSKCLTELIQAILLELKNLIYEL